jgi:hypothetical protein
MLSEATVALGSEQEPPDNVTVTVVEVVAPLALQLLKPLSSDTVGEAGIVNAAGNATVIVLPPLSAPFAVVMNPTVQLTLLWFCAALAPASKEMFVAAVEIVTPAAGFTAVVSTLVLRLKAVFASDCAAGLVTSVIVSVAEVELAS